MGQFSRTQTESINHAVADCSIMRLTVGETQEWIKQNLNIDVSYETVRNYRYRQKGSAMQWIKHLARSKRADYIYQYKERIDEVETVQRKLWEIMNAPETGPATKVKAAEALLHCSDHLCSFYDAMPVVNAMGDYINGKYGGFTLGSHNNFDGNSYGVTSDDDRIPV